jgi:chromosome segregation ATPase
MKRAMLSLFACLLAISAFAQDKAAQIADLQNQLTQVQSAYLAMEKRYDALSVQKDNIKFAVDTYTKYHDQYVQDVNGFNQKQDEVNRQQQLLQPSVDNYRQRLAAHNASQCTEVQGSGTCNWYNNEANSIDAQKAAIQQAQSQVDQQNAGLNGQRQNLAETKSKLDTIWDQNQANITQWKADMGQLKADYDANIARENAIKAQLAALYGSVNACLKAIPPACANPVIGPDGRPILDQNCEIMKAQCSKMFDGNK